MLQVHNLLDIGLFQYEIDPNMCARGELDVVEQYIWGAGVGFFHTAMCHPNFQEAIRYLYPFLRLIYSRTLGLHPFAILSLTYSYTCLKLFPRGQLMQVHDLDKNEWLLFTKQKWVEFIDGNTDLQ